MRETGNTVNMDNIPLILESQQSSQYQHPLSGSLIYFESPPRTDYPKQTVLSITINLKPTSNNYGKHLFT